MSDPDTARAQDLAAGFDGVRSIGDPLDLVADDDVDAVIIASPGFVHEEQLLACIEHGKYALCEKPLTMDSESSLRLVEAEVKAGQPRVQVGFMRRFDPRVRTDEDHARQRAVRPDPGAAQHAPQQDRPGLVPLRDRSCATRSCTRSMSHG